MNDNAIPKSCPQCGSTIPADAPQGLCPKCILSGADTPTYFYPAGDKPVPPSIELVRSQFPQLEILELIGQGGMGFVYKARQRHLDRFVALKLLWPKLAAQPAFAERFNREARVLARLNHPNIVAVYDFGQAGEFFFLLMEFVDGVNMRQAMKSGRFSPAEALALVPRICDALQFAHEEGVLHRDIKPENILLDTKGRLKIADFGIAKLIGSQPGDLALTETGVAVGTPHYMAPEQLERPQEVDQRADIYSLGVVFYEMLTGELPVGRFEPPSEKAAVDPRVDEIVFRALEKQREKRYSSAGEVRTRVENIRSTPPPPIGSAANAAGQSSGPHGTMRLEATPPLLSQVPPRSQAPQNSPLRPTRPWSGKAILAAILSAAALLPGILGLMTVPFARVSVPGGAPPTWLVAFKVVFLFGLLFGVPALLGTVLGALALRDVRRSQGQLRGGPLALCAALFWPMLIMDLVALRAVIGLGMVVPGHLSVLFLPALLLFLAVTNFLIAWVVWRRTNGPGKKGWRLVPAVATCVLLVVSLPALAMAAMVGLPGLMRTAAPPSPRPPPISATPRYQSRASEGVEAEFVLPPGQVGIFELVTREMGEISPVAGLAAFAIAAPDQQTEGTFRCVPQRSAAGEPQHPPRQWTLEIAGAGNKTSAGGVEVPEFLAHYSGQISLWKALQPDTESVHWAGPPSDSRPTLGLRIRTHRSEWQFASRNSAVGLGTNWLKAFGRAEANTD